MKATIPKADKGADPSKTRGSKSSGPDHKGITRGRRNVPGGVARTSKPVHNTHEAHDNHAKRYATGQMNQGGYLRGNNMKNKILGTLDKMKWCLLFYAYL